MGSVGGERGGLHKTVAAESVAGNSTDAVKSAEEEERIPPTPNGKFKDTWRLTAGEQSRGNQQEGGFVLSAAVVTVRQENFVGTNAGEEFSELQRVCGGFCGSEAIEAAIGCTEEVDGGSFDTELAESGAGLGGPEFGEGDGRERGMVGVRGGAISEEGDMDRGADEALGGEEATAAEDLIVLMRSEHERDGLWRGGVGLGAEAEHTTKERAEGAASEGFERSDGHQPASAESTRESRWGASRSQQ